MKIIYPDFFNKFRCIASACSDSCCVGWEVDIDPFTLSIYENAEGDFGERLRKNIAHDDCDHFILQGERCPFLNECNLCDIFTELGEENLCDICTEHPRFYEWFGSRTEKGLGLCCEEVCRLLFEKEDKLKFICEENSDDDEEVELDEELFETLILQRENIFDLLQDRSLSIKERLLKLTGDAEMSDGEAALKAILGFFVSLESIDGSWQKRLRIACEDTGGLISAKGYPVPEIQYEHFMTYIIYRYYLKAVFDGDTASKLTMALAAAVALRAADLAVIRENGIFTFADRVTNAKGFSKDVEYSGDNLLALQKASENVLRPEVLAAAIKYIF